MVRPLGQSIVLPCPMQAKDTDGQKENQNNQTTHEENTNKVEDSKANVNIDADSVVVNNNNPITDDEFFDDFFGDE